MPPQSLLFSRLQEFPQPAFTGRLASLLTGQQGCGHPGLRGPDPHRGSLPHKSPQTAPRSPQGPPARQGNGTGCHAAATFAPNSAPDPAPPRRACSHAAGSPTYLGWRTDSEKTTWRYHTTPLRALSTADICPLPHRARAFDTARPAPWRKLPLPACRAALARQNGIGALCGAGYGGGFAQHRASAGPQRQ